MGEGGSRLNRLFELRVLPQHLRPPELGEVRSLLLGLCLIRQPQPHELRETLRVVAIMRLALLVEIAPQPSQLAPRLLGQVQRVFPPVPLALRSRMSYRQPPLLPVGTPP